MSIEMRRSEGDSEAHGGHGRQKGNECVMLLIMNTGISVTQQRDGLETNAFKRNHFLAVF